MKKPEYSEKTLNISKEIVNNCNRCKKCMKECVMMNDFGECPQDIFEAFLKDRDIHPIIPYSCTLCNRCTMLCPKSLEIAKAFMGMRESIINANGGKSPLKSHRAVYIHQLLGLGLMNIFTTRRKRK
jgi:heterodisulfide reductase subunit C